MSDPLRYILITGGGQEVPWCRNILPRLKELGKAVAVGAVDTSEPALRNAQQYLGVSPEHCFTDVQDAFDKRKADFVVITTPTNQHEKLIDLALIYDLHILMEPPVADSMAATCRVYRKVQDSPKIMGLAMHQRYDQDKQTLEQLIRQNKHGRVNYVVGRFTENMRKRPTWGRFRHEMDNPLLVEAAVQHFDVLRALCGSDAKSVQAVSWNPAWGEYRGDSSAIVIFEMLSGAHCVYEGSVTNASALSAWNEEYFRAECAHGTMELNQRQVRILKGEGIDPPKVTDVPLLEQPAWGNAWLAEKFCDWLRGGPRPTNRLRDYMQVAAMVFAAVQAAHTGKSVDVQEFLKGQKAAVSKRGRKTEEME